MADLKLDQVMNIIAAQLKRAGTQKALASDLGISQAYLNDVLQGRREPAGKLLAALGLERVVTYRKTEKANA